MITRDYFNSLKTQVHNSFPTAYQKLYVEPNMWLERNITVRIPETILSASNKIGIIAENILFKLGVVIAIIFGLRRTKEFMPEEVSIEVGGIVFDAVYESVFNFTDPYNYLQDLNHSYLRGQFAPTHANPQLEEKMGMLVSNRSHTMLIGNAGTGKTSAILSFVKFLESPECPSALKGKRVYRLDLDVLLGNSKNYLKHFAIMFRVLSDPNAILFIDEAHRLNEEIHGHRLSDSLKIYLESRNIVIIGATTKNESEAWFKQDPAMKRRFHVIEMPAMTQADHFQKLKAKFSKETISDAALEKAIEIAKKLYPDEALPASAVKVIHSAQGAKKYREDTSPVTLQDLESFFRNENPNI